MNPVGALQPVEMNQVRFRVNKIASYHAILSPKFVLNVGLVDSTEIGRV